VQILGLVHDDVPVERHSRLPEQVRGLVSKLDVSGLAGRTELTGDTLRRLPHLAALRLAEWPTPSGAQAGQVRLLGMEILGQDDLLPLVLQERGRER